jgi:hypothetical protein
MGGHDQGRSVAFRNRPYVAIGWGAVALAFYLFFLGASSIGGEGTFGIAIVLGLVTYLLWLIGCCSAVRMNQSGMIVDDVVTRHVIPWGDLQGIEVRGGLVFEVRGVPPIRMLMFGGSLYGVITGYRQQRKVAARMNAAREWLAASQPVTQPAEHYVRRSRFSLWPPLVIVALMEVVAVIGVLVK